MNENFFPVHLALNNEWPFPVGIWRKLWGILVANLPHLDDIRIHPGQEYDKSYLHAQTPGNKDPSLPPSEGIPQCRRRDPHTWLSGGVVWWRVSPQSLCEDVAKKWVFVVQCKVRFKKMSLVLSVSLNEVQSGWNLHQISTSGHDLVI